MEQPEFKTVITFGSAHLHDFNVEHDGWVVIVSTLVEHEARQLMFNTPGIGHNFGTSYPYNYFKDKKDCSAWHYYTYEDIMLRRIIEED